MDLSNLTINQQIVVGIVSFIVIAIIVITTSF